MVLLLFFVFAVTRLKTIAGLVKRGQTYKTHWPFFRLILGILSYFRINRIKLFLAEQTLCVNFDEILKITVFQNTIN